MEKEVVKSYKGFDKDLKCRDFQFEIGKEYEEETANCCNSGFHACENPLDVFKYYSPASSRFCEVEQSGDIDKTSDDSKAASTKIKIGAEIKLSAMIKAGVEFIFAKKNKKCSSGDESTAATSGYKSTAATSGNWSTAATSGIESTAATSGYKSTAATSGDESTAATSGNWSTAAVTGKESVAIATGYKSKARASLGSAIVLCERGEWDGKKYPLLGIKAAIIDGINLKADTFYLLKNGEFVEENEGGSE